MSEVVFGCADGFAAVLGSFDGIDRRAITSHAVGARPERLLVSIHEQLHEELQWSTGWGATAAMAGLLAAAGVRATDLGGVAGEMNSAARRVHECFATTISSGVVGVPEAQELLAGNPVYLGYLNDGLALGGDASLWPWQFRESAIQMLLRLLMQPAHLASIAERGFGSLRTEDLQDPQHQPDYRLNAVRELVRNWWTEAFESVICEHPLRGGDSGGEWARDLPEGQEEMERLKAWEETILIPAIGEVARRHLAAAGFPTLSEVDYHEVVDQLRSSFLELAPDDWQVEVFTERRRMSEEMLGGEREALVLDDARATVELCEPDQLTQRAADFVHGGPDGPLVISVLLERGTLSRQFDGLQDLSADGSPLLTIAGQVNGHSGARHLPIAVMKEGVTPVALARMFESLPVLTLSTLRASLYGEVNAQLLALDQAFVLVDLPLRTQVASWIEQAGHVRCRVVEIGGRTPMNLILLQLEGLSSLWLMCFRSDAGLGELAQLLDRYQSLTADLEVPPSVARRAGVLAAWIHQAWWALEEVPPL